MAQARSNSACLIVGDTGTGKSSLIATLAEKVWKDHKKKTLYYLADGGGYGTQLEVLIERGIVWVWKMRTRGEAFETCAHAAKGYWPKNWNTTTGETSPGCKLLRPIVTKFELYCSCGNLVNTQPVKAAMIGRKTVCKCKALVDTTSPGAVVKEVTIRTPGFEDVGAVAFDGLTSMQQWIMDDLAERAARGTLKGEATGLGGTIISGDFAAGGNNRAHYGFAQSCGEKWILDSTAIPSVVAPPIWTALEERGQMADTKVAVYGPKLAGAAKTSVAPQWVGNCLGLEIYQDKKGRNIHRLHLQEYADKMDSTPHLCKNRSLPGLLPPYLEDLYDEDGNIENFKNFNLGTFFDLLDDALHNATIEAKKLYPDAPGLPSGSIGGDVPEEKEEEKEVAKKSTSGLKKASVRGVARI